MSVHSNEGYLSEGSSVHDESSTAGSHERGGMVPAETVAVREGRWELLREAKWSLGQYELRRRPEDREGLVAALEQLAGLMRGTK